MLERFFSGQSNAEQVGGQWSNPRGELNDA